MKAEDVISSMMMVGWAEDKVALTLSQWKRRLDHLFDGPGSVEPFEGMLLPPIVRPYSSCNPRIPRVNKRHDSKETGPAEEDLGMQGAYGKWR